MEMSVHFDTPAGSSTYMEMPVHFDTPAGSSTYMEMPVHFDTPAGSPAYEEPIKQTEITLLHNVVDAVSYDNDIYILGEKNNGPRELRTYYLHIFSTTPEKLYYVYSFLIDCKELPSGLTIVPKEKSIFDTNTIIISLHSRRGALEYNLKGVILRELPIPCCPLDERYFSGYKSIVYYDGKLIMASNLKYRGDGEIMICDYSTNKFIKRISISSRPDRLRIINDMIYVIGCEIDNYGKYGCHYLSIIESFTLDSTRPEIVTTIPDEMYCYDCTMMGDYILTGGCHYVMKIGGFTGNITKIKGVVFKNRPVAFVKCGKTIYIFDETKNVYSLSE